MRKTSENFSQILDFPKFLLKSEKIKLSWVRPVLVELFYVF